MQRHRSFRFQAYLDKLRLSDPVQHRQIVKAEQGFIEDWHSKLGQFETIYADQMEGYEDTPAGPAPIVLEGSGDWSWQPQRYPDLLYKQVPAIFGYATPWRQVKL